MNYQEFSDFYYSPKGKYYVYGLHSSTDVYKFLAERRNEWKAVKMYIHNFYYDAYGASWLRTTNKQTLEQFLDFIDGLVLKEIPGWECIDNSQVCKDVYTICKRNGISEIGYNFLINNEEKY